MDEISQAPRPPRGLRRADRRRHGGDARRGGRAEERATWWSAFEERPVIETRLLQRLIAAAPVGRGRAAHRAARRGTAGAAGRSSSVSMPDSVAAERVGAEFGFLVREPETRPTRAPSAGRRCPTVAVVVPRSRGRGGRARGGRRARRRSTSAWSVTRRGGAGGLLADAGSTAPLRLMVRAGAAVACSVSARPAQ